MPITHFLYWTLQLNPKPVDTLIVPLIYIYIMWRRVQFKVQFAWNWSLGFWSLDSCLKWSLKTIVEILKYSNWEWWTPLFFEVIISSTIVKHESWYNNSCNGVPKGKSLGSYFGQQAGQTGASIEGYPQFQKILINMNISNKYIYILKSCGFKPTTHVQHYLIPKRANQKKKE